MGEGILKDSVPEAHTDYIIAIISEEYGSIIFILIITIFLYIAFRIIKNCVLKDDEFLKLSLCGLASLLIFQTFIHIGVNTSLLPTFFWNDIAFFKLWRVIPYWKRSFSRSNFKLYKN